MAAKILPNPDGRRPKNTRSGAKGRTSHCVEFGSRRLELRSEVRADDARIWDGAIRHGYSSYRVPGAAGPSLEMSKAQRQRPSGSFRQTVMYLPRTVRGTPAESGIVIWFVP